EKMAGAVVTHSSTAASAAWLRAHFALNEPVVSVQAEPFPMLDTRRAGRPFHGQPAHLLGRTQAKQQPRIIGGPVTSSALHEARQALTVRFESYLSAHQVTVVRGAKMDSQPVAGRRLVAQ